MRTTTFIINLCIIVVYVGFLTVAEASSQVFFSDDFEDGDVSDWAGGYYKGEWDLDGKLDGAPILTAEANAAKSGKFGMRFTKDRTGNYIAAIVSSPQFGPLTSRFQVEFDILPDNYQHIIWLGEAGPFETHDEKLISRFGITFNDGRIGLRAQGFPALGQYVPDNFYHVTMVAEPSNNVFDVTVTGPSLRDTAGNSVNKLTMTDQEFELPMSAGGIRRINLVAGATLTSTSTRGLDNVVVGEPTKDDTSTGKLPITGRVILAEDFESYDDGGSITSGGWKNHASGISGAVTTETSYGGDKSYRMQGRSNWARVETHPIEYSPKVILKVAMMAPNYPTGGLVGLWRRSPHKRWVGITFGEEWGDSKMIGWYAGGNWQSIMEYELGRWYDIILSVNMTAGIIDVYIDGELKVNAHEFTIKEGYDVEYDVLELTADNANASNVLYVDELQILVPEEQPVNPTNAGKTLNLDGDGDYVLISNGSLDVSYSQITVEAWIKLDSNLPVFSIVSKFVHDNILGDETFYLGEHVRTNDGRVRWQITNAAIDSFVLPTAEWVHVVGTFDNGSLILYKNGMLEKQAKVSQTTLPQNTTPTLIGASHSRNTSNVVWFTPGHIDEVRIWNRTLSQEEIQTNMNRTLTGTEEGLFAYYTFDGLNNEGLIPDLSGNGNHGTLMGDAHLVDSTAPIGEVPEPIEKLVAYWNFDEGSGDIAHDSSGNGNNGTIHGATWVDNAACGKTLSFDGEKNYVDCGHTNSLTLTTFSVSAWIKIEDGDGSSLVVNKGGYGYDPPGKNSNYAISVRDNKFSGGFEEHGGADYEVESSETYNDGNWHFVVVTYDKKNLILYVDGDEVGREETSADPELNNTSPLTIGKNSLLDDRYFNGQVDEVRIYNYALSKSQIQADMNKCTPTSESESRKLIIPELTAAPGDTVTVPITIDDAEGVAGADISLTYDSSILTISEVKSTELSGDLSLIPNTETAGQISLSIAGAKGIAEGSGSLIDLIFTVDSKAEAGSETQIKFEDAALFDELGETIPSSVQDGKMEIVSACTKGDVNNDGKIRANDAIIALRIATGLQQPTDAQRCAADMNDDGKIRANDAIIILRKATGLAAPVMETIASAGKPITVMLSETHGIVGESVTVPLKVDSIDGLAGGNFCIAYDNTVLRAVDISSDSDVSLAGNIAEPGVVRIAFASADKVSNETVAEIRFDILADDVSPLTLQRAELYRSDALPVDSRKIDGQFSSWAMPPEHSALLQNFPNPFNPETWIPYQLKEGDEVRIRIYNVAGNLVRELELGYKPAGLYVSQDRAAYWDGRNKLGTLVASGVYFYSIKAGDFSAVRKLIVLK